MFEFHYAATCYRRGAASSSALFRARESAAVAFAANRLYLFAFFRNCLRRNIFGAVLSHFITFVRFLCLLRHIARGGIVCGLLRGSFGRMGVCNGLQSFGLGTQDSITPRPRCGGSGWLLLYGFARRFAFAL